MIIFEDFIHTDLVGRTKRYRRFQATGMAIRQVIDGAIFGYECLSVHLEVEGAELVALDGEEVIRFIINGERGSYSSEFIADINL